MHPGTWVESVHVWSADKARLGASASAAWVALFITRLFLRFPRNGQGSTLQEIGDQCTVYLQGAVVADEALLPEAIHKFTDPCPGGTNHLRQG